MHLLDRSLIVSFRLANRLDNVVSVGRGERNPTKVLRQVILNVALLEVVIVDLDRTGQRIVLSVNDPGCLPLATPVRSEVQVDA